MENLLYKTVKLLVGGVFSNFLASSYLIHHDERLPGDLEASRPRFCIHPFNPQEITDFGGIFICNVYILSVV